MTTNLDIQLRTAVADYLDTLDDRIAEVQSQIAAACTTDDEDRVRALRDELRDLNDLYDQTEDGTEWRAERAFRAEYGGAS